MWPNRMETGIPCMGWGNNQLVIGAPNGNTLGIDILNSICVNFDWINHILGWEQEQKQGYTKFTKLVTWILLWKKYIVHRCFKARYSSLSWTTAFLFNWLTNLVFKIWLKWNKKSFHSNAIKLKWLFLSSAFCQQLRDGWGIGITITRSQTNITARSTGQGSTLLLYERTTTSAVANHLKKDLRALFARKKMGKLREELPFNHGQVLSLQMWFIFLNWCFRKYEITKMLLQEKIK